MADQFVDALVGHVEGAAPGRTERERARRSSLPPAAEAEVSASEASASGSSASGEQGEPDANAANGGTDGVGEFSAAEVLERVRAVGSRQPAGATASTASGSTNRTTPPLEDADEATGVSPATDDIVEEPLAVRELKAEIAGLETTTRRMLAVYRDRGPETPPDAHVVAGGGGDRTAAYAHNRTLRTRGLVEHVGRGYYDYRLRELLRETLDGCADEDRIEHYARTVEEHALDAGD
jgi:hypothetical protein